MLVASTRGPAGYRLTPGKTYELFYWKDSWTSIGKKTPYGPGAPLLFTDVPSGGLYWLVEEGSRKEERPFTYDDWEQVFW